MSALEVLYNTLKTSKNVFILFIIDEKYKISQTTKIMKNLITDMDSLLKIKLGHSLKVSLKTNSFYKKYSSKYFISRTMRIITNLMADLDSSPKIR